MDYEMNTTPTVMPHFKAVISTKHRNDDRFTNEKIEQVPQLEYKFGDNGNWSRNDSRLPNDRSVYKFVENYWTQTISVKQPKYHYFGKNKTRRMLNPNRYTNRLTQYELELEDALLTAKSDLDKRWAKQFKMDFENEFNDDLVKFLKNNK
jgi:hypothetical protein